jgi:hypothetical protein
MVGGKSPSGAVADYCPRSSLYRNWLALSGI